MKHCHTVSTVGSYKVSNYNDKESLEDDLALATLSEHVALLRADISKLNREITRLQRIEKIVHDAPEALMEEGASLGIRALVEEDFPALYALGGKRVVLVNISEIRKVAK